MNLESINWGMVGSVAAVVGLIYAMFRNLKADLNEKFYATHEKFRSLDKRFDATDNELKQIRADTSDMKDRLSFLEAANIYMMPIEPTTPNPRSKAARDMWQRRKAKKLEKKE